MKAVRSIVAVAIGAALFFVLGRFASIPVFANTYVSFQYAVLGFFAVVFGPIVGVLVGLIGHALIDFTTYGPWWSWIVASGVVGLVMGLFKRSVNVEGGFGGKKLISFLLADVLGNGIAWFAIAPVLDILIYQEPVNKVFVQGLVAGGANIVTTAIVGGLLLLAFSKTRFAEGSLTKE